jgi:hypothetical protein
MRRAVLARSVTSPPIWRVDSSGVHVVATRWGTPSTIIRGSVEGLSQLDIGRLCRRIRVGVGVDRLLTKPVACQRRGTGLLYPEVWTGQGWFVSGGSAALRSTSRSCSPRRS